MFQKYVDAKIIQIMDFKELTDTACEAIYWTNDVHNRLIKFVKKIGNVHHNIGHGNGYGNASRMNFIEAIADFHKIMKKSPIRFGTIKIKNMQAIIFKDWPISVL